MVENKTEVPGEEVIGTVGHLVQKGNKRYSEKKKSNGNISGASSSRDSRKDDATNVCDSQMDKSKLNSLIGKRLLNGCNDDRGLKQKSIDSQSTVAAKTKLSNVHPSGGEPGQHPERCCISNRNSTSSGSSAICEGYSSSSAIFKGNSNNENSVLKNNFNGNFETLGGTREQPACRAAQRRDSAGKVYQRLTSSLEMM